MRVAEDEEQGDDLPGASTGAGTADKVGDGMTSEGMTSSSEPRGPGWWGQGNSGTTQGWPGEPYAHSELHSDSAKGWRRDPADGAKDKTTAGFL